MLVMLSRLFFLFGFLLIIQTTEADSGQLSPTDQETLIGCMTDLVKAYGVDDVKDYTKYATAINTLISQGWGTFYGTFCHNEGVFFNCFYGGNLNTDAMDKFNLMNVLQIDFEAAVGYARDFHRANYLCGSGKPDAIQAFDCVFKLNVVSSNCYMSDYNCWTLAKYQDCVSTDIYGKSCGVEGQRLKCNLQNIDTSTRYSNCAVFLSGCY